MRTTLFILAILLSFTNCAETDDKPILTDTITGTWRLSETFSHPPTGNGWTDAENAFDIAISSDNTFVSSQFSECNTGTFSFTSTELILTYSCNGFTAGYETPDGVFSYNYQFIDNKLELTPTNFTCFEGCKSRFTRVVE